MKKSGLAAIIAAAALIQPAVAGPVDPAISQDDPALEWGGCPPFFPEGCRIAVLSGDPAGADAAVFFQVPGETAIPAHWHSSSERMVLVSGSLKVRYKGGEAFTLVEGQYAFGAPKAPHEATCISVEPCTLFIAFEAPIDAEPYDGSLD